MGRRSAREGVTVSKPRDRKAAQKKSAAADRKGYEDTPFGRRRTGRTARIFATLFGVAAIPIALIYRRLRRSRSA